MDTEPLGRTGDLDLAARAAAGAEDAWHDFVLRYAGLVRAVVRRYHRNRSEDDQLNLFVEIIEFLYREGLARYDGRAALSTWVITVSRSRALDALRREHGRRRPPKWVESLPAREQQIYQLAFVELRSIPHILDRLEREGFAANDREIEATVRGMIDRMDPPARRRLEYDREARSRGFVSGRLLQALDSLRVEQETLAEGARPDSVYFEKQVRELLDEVQACLQTLNDADRQILILRYYESLSAPDIARRLDLPTPRSAYRLVERALASLRSILLDGSSDPERRRWREFFRRGRL